MMDMMSSDYSSGMMGSMWFFSLLFWVLVIVGSVFIVRWMTERKPPVESALDMLKKRYACGEIDRDTFEQMKRDIDI